jgi:hypothetical protein
VVAEREGSRLAAAAVPVERLGAALDGLAELAAADGALDADIYLRWEDQPESDAAASVLQDVISAHPLPGQVRRVTTTVAGRRNELMHHHFTFRRGLTGPTASPGLTEERLIRGLHPHIAQRMQLERLNKFDLTRLPSTDEEVYLYQCVARENPADDRLVAFAQIRDLTELREPDGRLAALPTAEYTIAACLDSIRRAQSQRSSGKRFHTNRVVVYVWPPVTVAYEDLLGIANRVLATSVNVGLEELTVIARYRDERTGELVKTAARVTFAGAGGAEITVGAPTTAPVEPLDDYRLKVLRAASRGTVYPYELVGSLGEFTEYDLDDTHALIPVSRPKGRNRAAMVTGVVSTATRRHPQGVARVVLLGDPTKSLGALSEPECRRVIAALDLAEQMRVPVEWYALSSGARISMESGTENMDWVGAALKRIVEFTQDGGEINIVVAGITVGAQPYWNAEATMLMHTKGILVMTPDSAMVLTGKQALDFSGGVSAEDNFGIGGYDRIMGPNVHPPAGPGGGGLHHRPVHVLRGHGRPGARDGARGFRPAEQRADGQRRLRGPGGRRGPPRPDLSRERAAAPASVRRDVRRVGDGRVLPHGRGPRARPVHPGFAGHRRVRAGRFRAGDPALVAHQLWMSVHGIVNLEIGGYLFEPYDADACFDAQVCTLLVGSGDDPERARASVARSAVPVDESQGSPTEIDEP